VPRVNVVLSDFRVKEVETVKIVILTVNVVMIAVDPDVPFAGKVCGISLKKSGNPAQRNGFLSICTCEILYHHARRW
jgi:hypothetical protein